MQLGAEGGFSRRAEVRLAVAHTPGPGGAGAGQGGPGSRGEDEIVRSRAGWFMEAGVGGFTRESPVQRDACHASFWISLYWKAISRVLCQRTLRVAPRYFWTSGQTEDDRRGSGIRAYLMSFRRFCSSRLEDSYRTRAAMARTPASRKIGRVLALLALFWACQPEPKTGASQC